MAKKIGFTGAVAQWGKAMPAFALILLILTLSGCASFSRTEMIETDKLQGFATGTYKEDSGGRATNFGLALSGGSFGGSSGGMGAAMIGFQTGPPTSGSKNFAKALAMINYSKSLKSIQYDETGGIISYEFERQPTAVNGNANSKSYQPTLAKPKAPSSFGYQPIE